MSALLRSRLRLPTSNLLGQRGFANMVKVSVNGVEVSVDSGATVLQACEKLNIDVPRFCFHERLSVAGNCRMCLVEIEKSIKPVASCAMPVMPGMNIFTDTPLVKKAREGVLEFLLLNHPLDCPICDQGGECDLQDQAMIYGSDRSRFYELKRGVEDKNLGPLVKTVMTRCIHCTRCVRFGTEVAGVETLGTTNRGIDTEVGTYVDKHFVSEISGNIIDLCPVGALTSKPYAFTARPWEMKGTESIDIHDSTGASIRIDTRGTEVMRIVPRLNEAVNEEWLSDKGRFAYDGMKVQRLTSPMVRDEETGALVSTSWEEALGKIGNYLKSEGRRDGIRAKGVIGGLVDLETAVSLKDFLNNASDTKPVLQTEDFGSRPISTDFMNDVSFGSTIAAIEEADLVLLVGGNLREEAPLINARIRKKTLQGNFEVITVGTGSEAFDENPFQSSLSSYNFDHTPSPVSLADLVEGNCPELSEVISNAKSPLILYGKNCIDDSVTMPYLNQLESILQTVTQSDMPRLNFIHPSAGSMGALGVGYNTMTTSGTLSTLHRKSNGDLGVDHLPNFVYAVGVGSEYAGFSQTLEDECRESNAFVVYQGHHGVASELMLDIADVVLPGAAYTEKNATYINTEGRAQETTRALFAPSLARTDWKILRALSEVTGSPLPYNNESEMKCRVSSYVPSASKPNYVVSPTIKGWDVQGTARVSFDTHAEKQAKWMNQNLRSSAFYQTDIISENSAAMAKTQSEFVDQPLLERINAHVSASPEEPLVAVGK